MGIFKSAKKAVTGEESAKTAFREARELYDEIDDFNFMPFDMIVNTCSALDVLFSQEAVRSVPIELAVGMAAPSTSTPKRAAKPL